MDSSREVAKSTIMDDAVQFIFLVKKALLHTNNIDNKYNQFASALKLFDQGIISSEGLVQMLEHLFQGHENLTAGLAKFTPENQRTIRAVEDFGLKSELAASRKFLDNVKNRFKDKVGVYQEFLDALIDFRHRTSVFELRSLYEKVFRLFFGHPDLLSEFEYFLNQNGKVREQVESIRLCLIEDRLFQMDVLIGNLQSATSSLSVCCFEKLYGEVMDYFSAALLMPNPTRDFGLRALRVHPMKDFGLQTLTKKKEEIQQIRSKFTEFLKEYHRIRSRPE